MPLPWLVPGIALALVVSVAASRPVGARLGIPRRLAAMLILCTGVVLAATLTPHIDSEAVSGRCTFTRFGPASLRDYRSLNDTTLNVLLFIPLGAAIAVVPRGRMKAAMIGGAVALPFALETVQLLIPWLDRSCESDDVFDNLTGLAIGLVIGSVANRVRRT